MQFQKNSELPRGISKNHVSEKGWSEVFDLLFDKYLIETPDNFYDEEPPFNDADELNNIFQDLEKKNLDMIYELQDTKSNLEDLTKQTKALKAQSEETIQQLKEALAKERQKLFNVSKELHEM